MQLVAKSDLSTGNTEFASYVLQSSDLVLFTLHHHLEFFLCSALMPRQPLNCSACCRCLLSLPPTQQMPPNLGSRALSPGIVLKLLMTSRKVMAQGSAPSVRLLLDRFWFPSLHDR